MSTTEYYAKLLATMLGHYPDIRHSILQGEGTSAYLQLAITRQSDLEQEPAWDTRTDRNMVHGEQRGPYYVSPQIQLIGTIGYDAEAVERLRDELIVEFEHPEPTQRIRFLNQMNDILASTIDSGIDRMVNEGIKPEQAFANIPGITYISDRNEVYYRAVFTPTGETLLVSAPL